MKQLLLLDDKVNFYRLEWNSSEYGIPTIWHLFRVYVNLDGILEQAIEDLKASVKTIYNCPRLRIIDDNKYIYCVYDPHSGFFKVAGTYTWIGE